MADEKYVKPMPRPLNSEIKTSEPVIVAKPIQVEAIYAGWYKRSRKSPGDKFTVEGEHQLGKWMKKI